MRGVIKYLAIGLAALAVGVAFAYFTTQDVAPRQVAPTTQQVKPPEPPKPVATVTPEGILGLINAYRRQNGLSDLTPVPELTQSATEKCLDMLDPIPDAHGVHEPYFDHVNPDTGVRGVDIARRAYPNASRWSENLAEGVFSKANQPVDAWIASPSHRETVLEKYKVTGIAICPQDNSTYIKRFFVQHFAR